VSAALALMMRALLRARVVRVAIVVTCVSRRAAQHARHNTSRLFPVPKCMC